MKNPTVLGRCDTNEGCDIEVNVTLSEELHRATHDEKDGGTIEKERKRETIGFTRSTAVRHKRGE